MTFSWLLYSKKPKRGNTNASEIPETKLSDNLKSDSRFGNAEELLFEHQQPSTDGEPDMICAPVSQMLGIELAGDGSVVLAFSSTRKRLKMHMT